jgi:hypothetical protein
MKSFEALMPNVVRTPAVRATRSLIAIGTPANGRGSPASIWSAAASACSAVISTKAFSSPFRASMASSDASTSSRAVTSPSRTRRACSSAGRNISSSSIAQP